MSDEKTKIGAGHASAMLRLGLKELREAVNPSKESVAREELGLYGTLTPGEIAAQKENQETSILNEIHDLMSNPPRQQKEPPSNDLTR